MKREIAALMLLALLMLGAVCNIRHADFLTGQIECNLARAEHALERGDAALARTATENALQLWRGARAYAGVFLRHPDVDNVTDAFYDLLELLGQKDLHALPTGFARLRYHLETLNWMEHLSLGTLF